MALMMDVAEKGVEGMLEVEVAVMAAGLLDDASVTGCTSLALGRCASDLDGELYVHWVPWVRAAPPRDGHLSFLAW